MATTGVLLLQLLLLEKATNATTTPTTLDRGRGGKRAQIQHDASQSVAFAVLAFELKKRVPRAARREREREKDREKKTGTKAKERANAEQAWSKVVVGEKASFPTT
jgi:hypothetical protein